MYHYTATSESPQRVGGRGGEGSGVGWHPSVSYLDKLWLSCLHGGARRVAAALFPLRPPPRKKTINYHFLLPVYPACPPAALSHTHTHTQRCTHTHSFEGTISVYSWSSNCVYGREEESEGGGRTSNVEQQLRFTSKNKAHIIIRFTRLLCTQTVHTGTEQRMHACA